VVLPAVVFLAVVRLAAGFFALLVVVLLEPFGACRVDLLACCALETEGSRKENATVRMTASRTVL
jgi:hypothetical protein